MEKRSDPFPQRSLAPAFLSGGLKYRTAELLELVDQESQHRQVHEHCAQVLVAQAVIVAEVVTLVLQGIEGLVLYPPPGAATTHDVVDVSRGQFKIRHPAETLLAAIVAHLPVLEDVDLDLTLARC